MLIYQIIQGDDMCFNLRVAKILTCNSITCNCDLAKCVVIILILIDQTKLEGVSLLFLLHRLTLPRNMEVETLERSKE